MTVFEKPPLNEDLLIHFGIKGMKWGVRKKRPDEEERKKFFNKQRATRLAIGAAALAGTAATIYLLNKRGDVKAADLMSERAINRYNPRARGRKGPIASQFADARRRYREAKEQVGGDPSPLAMQMEVGRRAQLQAMDRIGNQRLTEKAWRDQARLQQLSRDMDDTTDSLLDFNNQLLGR